MTIKEIINEIKVYRTENDRLQKDASKEMKSHRMKVEKIGKEISNETEFSIAMQKIEEMMVLADQVSKLDTLIKNRNVHMLNKIVKLIKELKP